MLGQSVETAPESFDSASSWMSIDMAPAIEAAAATARP
jgi:hypothetical protein